MEWHRWQLHQTVNLTSFDFLGSSPSSTTMNYINKVINWGIKLISNNTGVSSKNFFLVSVTLIGLLLLTVPIIVLLVEVLTTHTIATDLNGMAAYIGAVASVFATAGITKAWSEKYENNNKS